MKSNSKFFLLPFFMIVLVCCKCQSNFIKTSIVETESKVSFANFKPKDTVINYKYYYDSSFVLKKQEQYIKNEIYSVIFYNPETASDTVKGNYTGNIINSVVVRRGLEENWYDHSKLFKEVIYDGDGNEVISKDYDIHSGADSFPAISKHLYGYNHVGRVISDTFLAIYKKQVDTQYEAVLIYNEAGKLEEKKFIRTFCCEGNEPFPDDRILYFYDLVGNLSREIHIQDLKIKRTYRDPSKEYSTVSVIGYSYNKEGMLSDKKVFAPNMSQDTSLPIEKLFVPRGLEEEYVYKYD